MLNTDNIVNIQFNCIFSNMRPYYNFQYNSRFIILLRPRTTGLTMGLLFKSKIGQMVYQSLRLQKNLKIFLFSKFLNYCGTFESLIIPKSKYNFKIKIFQNCRKSVIFQVKLTTLYSGQISKRSEF